MIDCYKSCRHDDWKHKTYKNGQIIIHNLNPTVDELLEYLDKAFKVNKFVYGVEILIDEGQKYAINVVSIYNIATMKKEYTGRNNKWNYFRRKQYADDKTHTRVNCRVGTRT